MEKQTNDQKQKPSRAVLWSYVNPYQGYAVKFIQMQYHTLTGPIPRAFIVRFYRATNPKIILSLEGRHPCSRALKILLYLQRTRPNLLPKLTAYPFFWSMLNYTVCFTPSNYSLLNFAIRRSSICNV